uniref:FA complementation group D2 n=1 Tax=Anolis carolinensis TaxID=28377 RepID=A0A803TND8_ANOCA
FQKKLHQALRKHPSYPQVVEEFITGLESHIENRDQFRNCLLPCVPVQNQEASNAVHSYCESLIKLVGSDGLNLPRLIVNQLKWLDRIVNSKELLSTIMQMICVSPLSIQHDIITSLPEILEDAQHSEVARELSSLLKEKTELTVPILDALSSLNLDLGLLSEVRDLVINGWDHTQVLENDIIISLVVLYFSLPASQVNVNQDCIKLLFEVIKSAIKFQKTILEGWIKAIENVYSASDHKVLDLIVLFLIYATNSKIKKQIERMLRNKIRSGCLREQLLRSAFRYHPLVMRDLFPAILSLAEVFVHSADSCIVSFGSYMYKQAFTAFDVYCQQEIVGALVTHACGGNSEEVDVALDMLTDLVSLHTSSVVPYGVFLKSILDYMDNLSPQQIRKLFHILSVLAFSQGHRSSHIQDDIHMVIRKQLSSTIPKYRRIGIIGALTMVGSMAAKRINSINSSITYSVYSSCGQIPQALALYYDELANLIQKGNMDLQILVGYITDDLYWFNLVPIEDSAFLFPVKALYCLEDEESEATIAINLLPLVSQSYLNKHENEVTAKMSPVCLSPFFRLLRLCISELNSGNLEDIDALLVCPLYLTNLEVGGKLDSLSKEEREFLCTLLFHALNWFHEVVNAFCRQNDAEIKGRVLARLQNITELQSLLEKVLAASPGYTPPLANFDSETVEGMPINNTVGTTKKKNKGNRLQFMRIFLQLGSTSVFPLQDSPGKESRTSLIPLQSYSAYFRELDLEVFNILHCGLLTKSILDTEMHTKTREIVQIGPAELLFLLEDLCRKLEHVLIPAPAKRAPFLKGKGKRNAGFSHLCQRTSQEVIERVVEFLKPLCNHMENMHNFFQALMAENHGVVDGPGVNIQEHQFMSSCYQHLLQIFRLLFAWSGFSQHENHSLLKSGLHVLTDRLKPGEKEFSLEDLLSHSFQYLLNFQHSVPNIYCALSLTQLLLVIAEKSVINLKHKEIGSITKYFLCQSWMQPNGTRQKGTQFNDALHTLFCIYMEHTDNVLKAIEDISRHLLMDYLFPPLSHPQYGRLFVETFLKHGMPLLDYSFKKHREDVQSLLKTFQLSTRQLHHMCGHSKIHQDTGLTSHVPFLKKSLELFVYRVKAMLALNHCQEAFWVGVLKNRDLQVSKYRPKAPFCDLMSFCQKVLKNIKVHMGKDSLSDIQSLFNASKV